MQEFDIEIHKPTNYLQLMENFKDMISQRDKFGQSYMDEVEAEIE